MRFGDYEVRLINGGNFRLDGGAMHGVVPKVIWNKLVSCDDKNRVEYATNCLLLEGRGKRILIETGNGAKFSPKLRDIYGIDHDRGVEDALRDAGVAADSIDYVFMTHLHFDHSGGTTRLSKGGSLEPVFTRARHVIQRGEYEDSTHPHERNRASYLAENITPLASANLLDLIDGEREITPGISVLPTPGHTAHHQSILIDGGADGKLLFLGDIVPTSLHVKLPFIMAYDLDVVRSLETKRAVLGRAIQEKWTCVFGHDLETHAARLKYADDGQIAIAEPIKIA